MKVMAGCALFGAVKVLSGIRDAYILQHSVVGCNFGSLNFRNIHKGYAVKQASTVIYDNEVVYGGYELLVKGIKAVDKRFDDISTIFVVSGCVPNMIGDDVEMIFDDIKTEKRLVHIGVPGYQGNSVSGTELALLTLGDLVENQQLTDIPSVNIFGLTADDPFAEQDIAELERLFGDKVVINCNFVDTTIENIVNLSNAHLNIVFGFGLPLAQKLQRKFGTPYIERPYPVGIQGMIAFLNEVGEKLNVDFSHECDELYHLGQDLVRKTAYYLSTLYQQSIAIVGDKLHLSGMDNFFREELGMETFCYDIAELDERYLEKELEGKNVTALLGSGLQRELSRKFNIPFVGYCYPLQDQLCLTSGILGIHGTSYLLEMLINSILQQQYKTKGIYREILEGDGGNN